MNLGGNRKRIVESEKARQAKDVIARDCISVRLRLLNRVITNLYDDELRPLGLKVSQLNILVATAKLGVAQSAMICNLLKLDTSTLSRNLERMRERGWVEIVPSEDARYQPFQLTEQGTKLLRRAFPAWERAQEKACELLGPDGVALVTKTAKKLRMLQPGP